MFQIKVKDYYDYLLLKVIEYIYIIYYMHTHTHFLYKETFQCFFKKSLTAISN